MSKIRLPRASEDFTLALQKLRDWIRRGRDVQDVEIALGLCVLALERETSPTGYRDIQKRALASRRLAQVNRAIKDTPIPQLDPWWRMDDDTVIVAIGSDLRREKERIALLEDPRSYTDPDPDALPPLVPRKRAPRKRAKTAPPPPQPRPLRELSTPALVDMARATTDTAALDAIWRQLSARNVDRKTMRRAFG